MENLVLNFNNKEVVLNQMQYLRIHVSIHTHFYQNWLIKELI